MEVAAKLALFAGALVLAVVAGWGLGLLVGPVSFLPDSAPPSPVTAGEPAPSSVPDFPMEHP
jgi:hypothetical protein